MYLSLKKEKVKSKESFVLNYQQNPVLSFVFYIQTYSTFTFFPSPKDEYFTGSYSIVLFYVVLATDPQDRLPFLLGLQLHVFPSLYRQRRSPCLFRFRTQLLNENRNVLVCKREKSKLYVSQSRLLPSLRTTVDRVFSNSWSGVNDLVRRRRPSYYL